MPLAARRVAFARRFDPFGDHRYTQIITNAEDAAHDGLASLVLVDVADQRHIQFDQVGWKSASKVRPEWPAPKTTMAVS